MATFLLTGLPKVTFCGISPVGINALIVINVPPATIPDIGVMMLSFGFTAEQ